MKVSNVLFDIQNYDRTIRFPNTNVWTSVWSCPVWSKSFISEKIVPRNRISKSIEGKQFINVCWWSNTVSAMIIWSKLMQLCVLLALVCNFLAERFHTLKIELDFFSRQGHWTLCWTGVYQSLLLIKKYRRSCFFISSETGNFVIFCCKFVLK